ncbi:ATP-binding protein [Mycolicibacterium frederiksbergense]|uniref:ATP-binding protein n=1 Tax=Mycolicibacterium frederiksbergense TaxID=117567 RepID=A0A6H0S5R2_9MYCO|nr:ATP-binding protein [Mycolicibacterium frederiksbergense]QIV81675.1 ATP-binding protein [Mycolicibacterium frederiksbergense]
MGDRGRQRAAFSRPGVVATMVHAVQIRDDFAAWLARSLSVDAEKTSDIVLAVNEALANAAEHAYLDSPEPGPMHVRADHDPQLATLTVWITDEGRWRAKEPATAPNPARGRGLILMRALTDSAAVDSTATGTEVRLHWDQIAARPADAADAEQDDDRLLA